MEPLYIFLSDRQTRAFRICGAPVFCLPIAVIFVLDEHAQRKFEWCYAHVTNRSLPIPIFICISNNCAQHTPLLYMRFWSISLSTAHFARQKIDGSFLSSVFMMKSAAYPRCNHCHIDGNGVDLKAGAAMAVVICFCRRCCRMSMVLICCYCEHAFTYLSVFQSAVNNSSLTQRGPFMNINSLAS